MLPRLFRTFCLAVALLVLSAPIMSMRADAASGRVIMQIVLIRHGIRAPTKPPEALAIHAARPWPAWPVAPGQLTSHGAQLMRALGGWYRHDALVAGLLAAAGCPSPTQLKVIADSTPRNRASAAAMLEGFAPGCPVSFDAFAPGHTDPLFHGRHHAAVADTRVPTLPETELHELQHVLLGCRNTSCLRRARAAGKKVLLDEKPAKALKQAGSLSENLMLEYAQGMPAPQVGWGRLDAAAIGRLMTLHNAAFAFAHQTPAAASARDGNLLAHIAATLQAAAGATPALPALAPRGTRLLILVGHDTDLASQAGLLGLDWRNAEQPDDYPPGGALVYRLIEWRGHYVVRQRVVLPTLAALRAGDVGAAQAMHVSPLRLPGCDDAADCPLAAFQKLVAKAVKPADIGPASGHEPAAH